MRGRDTQRWEIIVAGTSGSNAGDFALARYNSDGTLDSSFGTNGKVTSDFFGDEDVASAMILLPDGRVVVAGYAETSNSKRVFALARYQPDVVAGPGDFSLGFNQPSVIGTRGTKVRITVNLNRTGGFTGDITVTPPDASAIGILTKPPEPIRTSDSAASWKFKIKGSAPTGPQQMIFTGRDDSGRSRNGVVTLVVE